MIEILFSLLHCTYLACATPVTYITLPEDSPLYEKALNPVPYDLPKFLTLATTYTTGGNDILICAMAFQKNMDDGIVKLEPTYARFEGDNLARFLIGDPAKAACDQVKSGQINLTR